jgi:hypothetical protein
MKSKMLTLAMLVVILLGIMPITTQAETLSGSGELVILFKTQDQMEFAINHLNSGGSVRDTDFLNTIAGSPQSGTMCSVIKSTWTTKQVRVMEGPFQGVVGWTPFEFVQP